MHIHAHTYTHARIQLHKVYARHYPSMGYAGAGNFAEANPVAHTLCVLIGTHEQMNTQAL